MTWNEVGKKLPKTYDFLANASMPVLVRTNSGLCYVAQWDLSNRRWIDIPMGLDVTHWMEIPPLR